MSESLSLSLSLSFFHPIVYSLFLSSVLVIYLLAVAPVLAVAVVILEHTPAEKASYGIYLSRNLEVLYMKEASKTGMTI